MSIAENWKLLDDSVSDRTLQYVHLDGLFCIPVTNVHHGEGEIAFESQGPNHGRSVSDLLSIHPDRLRVRAARSRITVKHYPSDAALGTIFGDASQGLLRQCSPESHPDNSRDPGCTPVDCWLASFRCRKKASLPQRAR
jgi:hypothetical protein